MTRAERMSVFSYSEYNPCKIIDFYPRHTTEQEFKKVLKRCMGTSSRLFMQIGAEHVFMPPNAFIQAVTLSPENQEKFLTITAQAMKQAEKVTVIIPTFKFSSN